MVNKGLHIGVIPDGNRRYAVKNGEIKWKGHFDGTRKMRDFLNWCLGYPYIKTVSIFALSTENLKRKKEELKYLWQIYKDELKRVLEDPVIEKEQVNVRVLGDSSLWSEDVKDLANKVTDKTKKYTKRVLNILLAYGSHFEIESVFKKLSGKDYNLESHLLVKEPVDLIIRTGGQRRLSNFMLYQAAYAELYFTDTLWPELSKKEFDGAIDWYHQQQKNFGH